MPDSLAIDLAQYSVFDPPDPFEDHVGPFYFRVAGDPRAAGSVHCVLPTKERHGNYAGGVHGGAILTFADYALCLVAGRAADGGSNTSFAMTVSIAVEFLDAGKVGLPIEASGEPLQVTGRLAFARGTITQAGRAIALWSGVVRHVARSKVVARKAETSVGLVEARPQSVPEGFELLANASVYSRHIGASYARKEMDGATLVQPTLPHMCNSGGVLHGGYMMSFADSAVTRAAGMTTGMAPATVAFAAEFLSAGDIRTPLVTRVEVPRYGKSLAFLRGVLEQDGRKLLSYSATIRLRPRA
ncbi:MAG: PaaI family thioesterase [Alphaproteobacteria bacterium]|nr:PaaI family thioesterase [Alphaproteobacteria bacterium]MBV8408827.1 PaaI family thioesterase [Alphaproteobacteria bacterium]